ncbi:MAG TPA: hypothetical protein VL101_02105, partial [Nordella sp.]|nr:hypothetical protein [Nordella sp.]
LKASAMASAAGRKRFSFIVHSLNEAGFSAGPSVPGWLRPFIPRQWLRVMVHLYTIILNAQ